MSLEWLCTAFVDVAIQRRGLAPSIRTTAVERVNRAVAAVIEERT